jgi:hypothetical protein
MVECHELSDVNDVLTFVTTPVKVEMDLGQSRNCSGVKG